MKTDLWADEYKKNVVQNTPIGKSLIKLNSDNNEGLRLKINIMQHIKNKDPLTDYPKLLALQKKNKAPVLQKSKRACSYATDNYGPVFGDYIGKVTMKSLNDDLLKANYYSVLCDRSTDKSVTKLEAIQGCHF